MANKKVELPRCGIIMPLATMGDEYSEEHWSEVRDELKIVIREAGFYGDMVSTNDANFNDVIMATIVQNLYDNPIVVCDVSNNNPNVLFELGMRLAFDQPTIIIKDDATKFIYDTSSIRHLEYPKDLKPKKLRPFLSELKETITATARAKINNENYSMFLKHFQREKIAKLETEDVSAFEHINRELKTIRESLINVDTQPIIHKSRLFHKGDEQFSFLIHQFPTNIAQLPEGLFRFTAYDVPLCSFDYFENYDIINIPEIDIYSLDISPTHNKGFNVNIELIFASEQAANSVIASEIIEDALVKLIDLF